MTASQSSTYSNGKAEKALTASPARAWPGTCTHTTSEAHAWWQVSLSGTWDVTSVQLTNRNGNLERLQGIDVFVGNTKCASDISVGDETKTIPCVGTGNSIKLQHTGTQLLTLCGFAAMGLQGKYLYYGAILWPHNTASPCCLTMLLLPHSVVSPLSFPFVVFPFIFSSLHHTHLLGICIGVSVCLHGPLLTVLGLMRNSESNARELH